MNCTYVRAKNSSQRLLRFVLPKTCALDFNSEEETTMFKLDQNWVELKQYRKTFSIQVLNICFVCKEIKILH